MLHLTSCSALAANIALLLAGGVAQAEEASPAATQTAPAAPQTAPVVTDAIPGSPVAPGLGLAPQAPPVPPAPGGRAPSFGAPTQKGAPQFRIGGRFFGYEMVGIGRKPSNPPPGYSGTPLHAPALSTGKIPFWGGSGATLNLEYGTPSLKAYVTYYFRLNGKERQGYYGPQQGPGFGVAYLLFSPDPIGKLRLQVKAGSFVEVYGGPGQWGWGIFGPMLALKGYGETTNAEWDVTRDVRVAFTHGLLVNPGVPEDFPRGDYNSWIETGTSSFVHHAHLSLFYKQYTFKLHYASAYGAEERTYLPNFLGDPTARRDGRMDTLLAEGRWQGTPWGQLGITGDLYNFDYAASVGNGVWWAVDWTQGTREMIQKYLGPLSRGNGKVAVVGAEYNFSVASLLWHPRSFNSRAPDIRISLAAMLTRTVATEDPYYKNAMGYFYGIDTEYRMTSHFSLTFQSYGEDREGTALMPDVASIDPSVTVSVDAPLAYVPLRRRFRVYSLNPGIAFRSDWTSLDRIQLIYSRRFYSTAADPNSAQPLDHHMFALGGYVTF